MRKTSILFVCIMMLIAFFTWTPTANAFPSFYATECAGCHGGAVSGFSPATGSCAGCHAHGTHSGTGTGDINITATPDKLVYAPGETVAVTINGGSGFNGYIRAKLFDQDCSVVTCDTSVTGPHVIDEANNPCPNGDCPVGFGAAGPAGTTTQYPVTILTGIAPSTPGTFTWSASWFGHQSDEGDAAFANWVPSSSNPTHGDEIVTFSFEVVAAPAPECEGDFNGDGDVDESDLSVFSTDFGRTDCGVPTICPGDFNNDGDVDGSDLAIFAADFGRIDCP